MEIFPVFKALFLILTLVNVNKNSIDEQKFDFYTEYNYFKILDATAEDEPLPDFADQKDYLTRLNVGKSVLGVGTQSYGHIRGELHILEVENKEFNAEKFDHIVESEINLPTGDIRFAATIESTIVLKAKVKPGKYGVRIYTHGSTAFTDDDVEGTDRYIVEIWPIVNLPKKVLKMDSSH
ncbi:hypothetical protein [Pedobacter miscanthi]|uniref:hypothetical protein n=1 Tax=Pedobacter miscanthi TaxID=2259170 RepID=UPI002931DCBE|nr:hypothetical protein [Pedobacter miscanthi]